MACLTLSYVMIRLFQIKLVVGVHGVDGVQMIFAFIREQENVTIRSPVELVNVMEKALVKRTDVMVSLYHRTQRPLMFNNQSSSGDHFTNEEALFVPGNEPSSSP